MMAECEVAELVRDRPVRPEPVDGALEQHHRMVADPERVVGLQPGIPDDVDAEHAFDLCGQMTDARRGSSPRSSPGSGGSGVSEVGTRPLSAYAER